MTVNSINNILYLKETKLDQNEAKRTDRGKVSSETLAQKRNDVEDVREVVEENRAAMNPSIDDLDQARQVLRSLVDMMGQKQDKTMMAHSGKAITQVF